MIVGWESQSASSSCNAIIPPRDSAAEKGLLGFRVNITVAEVILKLLLMAASEFLPSYWGMNVIPKVSSCLSMSLRYGAQAMQNIPVAQFSESTMWDFSKVFSLLVALAYCDWLAWKVNFVLTQMHTVKNTYVHNWSQPIPSLICKDGPCAF